MRGHAAPHLAAVLAVLAVVAGCAPEETSDKVLELGPLSLVLEVPTRADLSPLSDADELRVTVRDRASDRESTQTLRLADEDDRSLSDVPWGDAVDVVVEARSSAFDVVTGYAEVRGVPVRGDEEVRLRLLRRLVYSNVDTWEAAADGGAVWVSDLGAATVGASDVLEAPVVELLRDQQRPQDLYLTADARTLVVACVDYTEPDPANPADGLVRIYDTRDNELVGDGRPDVARGEIALPVALTFARPLGDGYRFAGLSSAAPTLFVVDVRSGEVTTHALTPNLPSQWRVEGAVATQDVLFVSAQINDEATLLRVDLRDLPSAPAVTSTGPGAGMTGAEARGVLLSPDGATVLWALASLTEVVDGDARFQSAVEVRTASELVLDRAVLLPARDFNVGALSRLPDGRIAGALQLIDRTPDDCCRGTALIDVDDDTPSPPVLPYGVAALAHTPHGDGIAVLDDFGNEPFQLVLFPQDGSAPVGVRPLRNAYYDSGSAVAVPYAR